jgi:RNA polymerase sigma-70 factor (ECF subfamily)
MAAVELNSSVEAGPSGRISPPASQSPNMNDLATSDSDAALVHRIRAGDERALEIVFRAHFAGMAAFVQRYVQAPDVAEELVQDIFLKLWSRREQLAEIESLKTYLYRAVRNQGLNWLRRRKLERRWEEEHGDEAEPTAPVATDDDASEQEITLAVRAAIDRLPPRCREIFMMSRDGGLTYNEIALALGISVKTVETQMGRALKALRYSLATWRQ